MKKIINENSIKYLSNLLLPKDTKIIITDLDKSVYSNFKLNNTEISTDLIIEFIKDTKDDFYIFKNKELNLMKSECYILPLKNNKGNIFGSIIFVSDNINKVAKRHFNVIRKNIEVFSENYTDSELKSIKSSPLYNKSFINEIFNLTNDSIHRLYCDDKYKHIEELLYLKILDLKSNLDKNNNKSLEKILELLEEEKKYFGMYSFILGNARKLQK